MIKPNIAGFLQQDMASNLRIDFMKLEPDAPKPLYGIAAYLKKSRIEQSLRDLVYIRASQLNGCAFCLDMHAQDARANGEVEQRINCISTWREAPFFSKREKAALELTEKLTTLSERHFSREDYDSAREEFDEHEFIALVMAINVINSWNRLMVSCGGTAGIYVNEELKGKNPGYFFDSE